MAQELAWDGVVDANTGEYYAGKSGNVGSDPVFAHLVNDVWEVVEEGVDVSQFGEYRLVVKEGKSTSRSTKES